MAENLLSKIVLMSFPMNMNVSFAKSTLLKFHVLAPTSFYVPGPLYMEGWGLGCFNNEPDASRKETVSVCFMGLLTFSFSFKHEFCARIFKNEI